MKSDHPNVVVAGLSVPSPLTILNVYTKVSPCLAFGSAAITSIAPLLFRPITCDDAPESALNLISVITGGVLAIKGNVITSLSDKFDLLYIVNVTGAFQSSPTVAAVGAVYFTVNLYVLAGVGNFSSETILIIPFSALNAKL